MQGLMTRKVAANEQGQLQGANGAIGGVAGILAPSLFGLSFAWALRHDAVLHQPGLPVLLASALLGLAFVIALRSTAPLAAPSGAD